MLEMKETFTKRCTGFARERGSCPTTFICIYLHNESKRRGGKELECLKQIEKSKEAVMKKAQSAKQQMYFFFEMFCRAFERKKMCDIKLFMFLCF